MASWLSFPRGPVLQKTPGTLCSRPTEKRYRERINYCERNVSGNLKNEIIREYDREFHYTIGQMNRREFKIDHYIPLCAGGSNEKENLWPQHQTIYELTDQVEGEICVHMSQGIMSQKEAIELIRSVKSAPETGPQEFERLQRLRN
jgi:hypothetical protein